MRPKNLTVCTPKCRQPTGQCSVVSFGQALFKSV